MTRAVPGAIDSPRNARVVAARELHSARGRRAAGAFLAEGPHAVAAACAAAFVIRDVFVTDEAADRDPRLMRELARSGAAIHTVTDRALGAVADTVTPQGIVAVVAIPGTRRLPRAPRLVAVLERCADPGNAGTVIRTADAVGADGVVLGAGSADVWSGKAVRASAGSVFHVPVETELEPAQAITELREHGCQVLATAGDGEVALDDLEVTRRLSKPTAWVFGSEAHGLGSDVRSLADAVVRIPIHGRAESFNLATAVAICLYSSARVQRSSPP